MSKYFGQSIGSFKTKVKPALVCTDDTTLKEILDALKADRAGQIVIVKDNKPIGIFTESDFMTKVCDEKIDLSSTHVSKLMTTHPTTVTEDQSLSEVLNYMNLGNFRRVVVVDGNGELSFVATAQSILRLVYDVISSKGL